MVNKNVLSCLLKDGKEVNAVMLVGRLFHAHATVTRNDGVDKVIVTLTQSNTFYKHIYTTSLVYIDQQSYTSSTTISDNTAGEKIIFHE